MKPYISFVVAARNDDYGGNFLHRMQVFVNVLLSLWDKHRLDAELIIVEWNPPEDRPRLIDALAWPECLKPGAVRIIEVSNAIHDRLHNSDRMSMFEYVAKNVGIRRARGEYVLATNPDLLFSEELIEYLSSRRLSKRRFYRIDRYDFFGMVPLDITAEHALRFAKLRVYQVNIREDRQRGLRVQIGRLRRWYCYLSGRWPGSYEGSMSGNRNQEHVALLDDDTGVYGGIYTNASGDFLLSPSDSWRAIRGFPEFTDTFIHLDSYASHQLHALGLEQAIFLVPYMILHAEHQRGEQKRRPKASPDKWKDDLQRIRLGLLGPAINDETWGLAGEDMPETTVHRANGSR